MLARVSSAHSLGLFTQLVTVEADVSNGLPTITIVGLAEKSVSESKERIRSAIKHSGFQFPLGRITINLAPADIQKNGSAFDLPIAIAVLRQSGAIRYKIDENIVFIGEVALDGKIRAVSGIINVLLWASQNNITKVFIPEENKSEIIQLKHVSVYCVSHLRQVVDHLNNEVVLKTTDSTLSAQRDISLSSFLDFAHIRGQDFAKRALEIAAAGGHNVLMIGPPGSGKTMLARSLPSILPKLSEDEFIDVNRVYSAAGLLKNGTVIHERPFRSPHHTASAVSIVGGGTQLKPGEVTLAHRGVLFLDEFAEFRRDAIEALRQPLEDGRVTIARTSGTIEYPSRFILIAAANPTTAGNYQPGVTDNTLVGRRYRSKLSGPITDRIDLFVGVHPVTSKQLSSTVMSETSQKIRYRVEKARAMQRERFRKDGITTNAEMTNSHMKKYIKLNLKSQHIMDTATQQYNLSARSYMRILRVARTIADLEESSDLQHKHILESLQFRRKNF